MGQVILIFIQGVLNRVRKKLTIGTIERLRIIVKAGINQGFAKILISSYINGTASKTVTSVVKTWVVPILLIRVAGNIIKKSILDKIPVPVAFQKVNDLAIIVVPTIQNYFKNKNVHQVITISRINTLVDVVPDSFYEIVIVIKNVFLVITLYFWYLRVNFNVVLAGIVLQVPVLLITVL